MANLPAGLTEQDLDGFTVEAHKKPEKTNGVQLSEIPAKLVEQLKAEAPKAVKDPENNRITIRVPVRYAPNADETAKREAKERAVKTAKLLGSYATAWGKGQTTPRYYITKVMNTRRERDEPIVHMKVQEWDKAKHAGRPAG